MAKFVVLYSGGKTPTTPQEGASGNVSNGYSLVEAADVGAAARLVKGCPIIAEGGKVHVFELAAM